MRGPKLPENATKKALYVVVGAVIFALVLGFFFYNLLQKNYFYPTKYENYVQQYAEEYDVDPMLVYAVIKTESSFDPNAESNAGARGLMQMTKDTFEWLKEKIAPEEPLTFDDLYEPDTSIRFGTYLLSISLQRYGDDISTAAAAYHSGWGTVDNLLAEGGYSDGGVVLTVFPYNNMSHYVNKINDNYEQYTKLYT